VVTCNVFIEPVSRASLKAVSDALNNLGYKTSLKYRWFTSPRTYLVVQRSTTSA
jgi:hypothetical protein